MDYYSVIGVENTASISEIKKAYRRKALKLHPDTGQNESDDAIKLLNEAYEVLSNEDKKKLYDDKMVFAGFVNAGNTNVSRKWQSIQKDIHVPINVPLKIALFGRKVKLNVDRIINDSKSNTTFVETINIDIPKVLKPMSIIKIDGKGNVFKDDESDVIGDLYVVVNFHNNEDGLFFDNNGVHVNVNVPFYLVWQESEVKVILDKNKYVTIKLSLKNSNGIYIIEKMFNKLPLIIKVQESIPEKNISEDYKCNIIKVMEEVYGKTKSSYPITSCSN